MADELKFTLIILGSVAILGLLAHGLWSVRKENHAQKKSTQSQSRIEPNTSSLKPDPEPAVKQEPMISVTNDASIMINTDPVFDEESEEMIEEEIPNLIQPDEVLILHITSEDQELISGAALLPLLLSLGFKFGNHHIFHRHLESNGQGPEIFHLSNMYNPGTFDIDNMEQEQIQGLSLFMTLPCHGDPIQTFNMMQNASKKIAEQFNVQVLDGNRSTFTIQTSRNYIDKIRQFQRKSLITQ